MTREIDNALLLHGGTDDISIPGAALRQNEELEEANKRVCDERDLYKSLCHQLEARLAGREFD